MLKSQIIKQLKKKHSSFKISQIESIFDIIIQSIFQSLKNGQNVEIRNFGKFSVKEIKSKPSARNPATGEKIFVPEKRKVAYKMAKQLKEIINKN